MKSLIPNTARAESAKPSTEESRAKANDSNRLRAGKVAKAAVDGLNRLARSKAAEKDPLQAA